MVRPAVGVPAFQPKEFQSLLDCVLEDVAVNRECVEPPAERVAWRYGAPVSLEKSRTMLRPQNRQTADIAGPAPDSGLTTDTGAVEIDEKKVEVIARLHREYVSHGEITIEDPGVIDFPSEPPETGEKRLVIDLRKFSCFRVLIEPPEKLPNFDSAHQVPGNKKGRAFDFVRLHPQHRFGGREADPHELLRYSPAPLGLASPETALNSFFQTLVLELLDDYRMAIRRGLHLGGINIVAPPVNGFDGRRRIDQT